MTKRVQETLVTVGCTLPEPSEQVAWAQLVELTGIAPACMGELVEMGWVEPVRTGAEGYLFRMRDVYRIQKLLRLSNDLGISVAGASIIVDLLARIEELEKEVAELRRLL
ncbi:MULTISPECIES: chaperone modulator CbpM [Desulfovibrio]|jgi:chaperone modulatory protein CbpM|uniref:chaperone modulator CbpM n=1 Tax=Desulfovibrio TaxID=872 RepID=UPI00040ACFD4|nr:MULTISPECIES: chaperone modulator CbpM [Desulfovibrio]MCM0756719.1 chaperone modulator CbpM [Desulfovibrio aminophilus]MDY0304947.1 chaperone modulator CbpM [Desulfovibrionaceae bacterium]HMM39515.1 chaperone modulator CbpM [Desulfovibrio sp.]